MTIRPDSRSSRGRLLPLLALGFLACGDLPRDPQGTLERARDGVLRVGVAAAPPWVTAGDSLAGEPGGPEAELVRGFASGIDAEVAWEWGGADETLMRLERRELDLVIAGLTTRSPWKARVALTRPHAVVGSEKHVVAAAPGENALLVAVERFIEGRP